MPTLPKLPGYLSGEFSDVLPAKVSVLPRGCIFGNGAGVPWPVHQRLWTGCQNASARSIAAASAAAPQSAPTRTHPCAPGITRA